MCTFHVSTSVLLFISYIFIWYVSFSVFQFSTVVTIHTTLLDVFSDTLRIGRRPSILMCVLCIVGFLSGLILCTEVNKIPWHLTVMH